MADKAKVPQAGDSMKTLEGLAVVLIVVLAVFMVTTLNGVNAELVKMNQQVDTLVTTAGHNSLGAFQAVDEDGKVQFRFTAVPATTMGMGDGACPGTCSTPGAPCAAGSAAAPCAAPTPATK